MLKKLKNIFSDIFKIKISKINNKINITNLPAWDSLNHANLIIAVEQEFGVRFKSDEISELSSFEKISKILKKKNTSTDKKATKLSNRSYDEEIILKGKNIYLRKLQMNDVTKEYVSWMNYYGNRYILNAPATNTRKKLKKYVGAKLKNPNALFFAIVDTNNHTHIGNTKLEPINWKKKEAIIGRIIGPNKFKYKGIGTESSRLLLNFAFKILKLKKVEGYVLEENIPSVKSNIKNGFFINKKKNTKQYLRKKWRKLLCMTITKQTFKKAVKI